MIEGRKEVHQRRGRKKEGKREKEREEEG